MKLKLYAAIVLLITISCNTKSKNTLDPDVKTNEISSQTTPNSLYEDLEGNPIKIEDYIGKKIVLNFWATWCVPCIKEMPSMLKSQEILKKENYVFLLASNEPTEKIKNFIKKTNYDFKFIKYTGSLAKLKIYVLPTSFVYNENGEKVDEITGAVEWDSNEIIEKLKNIQ